MADTELISACDAEGMKRAVRLIQNGGLVVFPTETVYGLGANALDRGAAAKVYSAKGRPSDNPLIIHVTNPEDAEKYSRVTPLYYKLADKFMPGPLTVIMPKRDCIPDTVTGGLDSVAVRVPSNPTAHRLIGLAGVPIAAPSANISGRPSPTTVRHVIEDLYGRVDAIIDGGDCEIGLESTVVKLTGESSLAVLRPGAVTPEMLSEICADVTVDRAVTEKFSGKPLAPGMKYRHYAPSAPLVILDGSEAEIIKYINEKGRENCGVLCYDGDTRLLSRCNAFSLGPDGEPEKQAHRLFACLRDFSGVDIIYSRMPSKSGIGLAVFNRLIKAAGYEVITL